MGLPDRNGFRIYFRASVNAEGNEKPVFIYLYYGKDKVIIPTSYTTPIPVPPDVALPLAKNLADYFADVTQKFKDLNEELEKTNSHITPGILHDKFIEKHPGIL